MVLLYWDIGRTILARQDQEGWGSRVIDRLAADLRQAFPDMHGFSPRNLKYMRAFAAAWLNRKIVQWLAAQIPAEYALRGLRKPVGVADWETRLTRTMPKDLAASLPTIEEIEAELSGEGTKR